MATEFDLICRFIRTPLRSDVVTGIGDDAAVLRVPPACDLIWSVDTLVGNVHFFSDAEPESIGHKSLAVNLSDLAAMGAQPAWATLALTLPQADMAWVEGFCRGFFRLADVYGVALVGGDTTQGPLSITVNIAGFTPTGAALLRGPARPGDRVYVSGCVGDAALAWRAKQQRQAVPGDVAARLHWPQPRVALGLSLRGVASAAIDVSDGLLADLGHLLENSRTGATLQLSDIPISNYARSLPQPDWSLLLGGGDDYELCFTVSPEKEHLLQEKMKMAEVAVSCIGIIDREPGLRLFDKKGRLVAVARPGYEHFSK